MKQYISAAKIFTGTDWLPNTALAIEDGKITELLPVNEVPLHAVHKHYSDGFLAPAFIDIQIYGAGKKLLAVYPEAGTLQAIYDYSKAGGAPLFLPTLATNTREVFYKGIDAVRQYWEQGGKGVWGLHLEGPWLHPQKRGAHIEALIHAPEMEEVKELLAYGSGVIKFITLAPEVCSPEVIKLIKEAGIVVSAGHSAATFDQATQAFDSGITTVTHLYNAMSPLQHRAPGVVGATLLHPSVNASIIADGFHVDFEAIRIAKSIMNERLFIITDAVTDTAEGPYQHQRAGDKYECNGVLSGSAITMHGSFKNLVRHCGIEVAEALRMCSLYPAKVIGAGAEYGKLAPGYTAQAVVINRDLDLEDVIG